MTPTTPATRSLVLEREFPHSPEKVWRALTEGPLLEQWLMSNDFLPQVGHRFTFRSNPNPNWNGVSDCEVLEVVPPLRLSYRVEASGEEATTGMRTVVTWALSPTEKGVRLRLEQSGFLDKDEANYVGAGFGWPRFLGKLERLLGDLR